MLAAQVHNEEVLGVLQQVDMVVEQVEMVVEQVGGRRILLLIDSSFSSGLHLERLSFHPFSA